MARADEFAGRVVVVTGGAGAGIGGATCRRFAELGAAVAVLDEHGPRAQRVAGELHDDFGVPVWSGPVDVS
jgi:2-hydroxycyclohexanecarboxyl-CoA dehydrogenase